MPLDEIVETLKNDWNYTLASLYNPQPNVNYNAYLVNLSHTVAAHLAQYAGRNVRVNLRQGKNIKKMQINVTTHH